jgi:hypothetical protein
VPVLPSEPCPPGLMAVPGDEACRPVMECPAGPWPDVPTDASTQYVLASADAMAGDGSIDQPWTTINEAIDAAPSGGTVLVGAGLYPETVFVFDKRIALWGVCPDLVTVEGQGAETVACFPTALCIAGVGASGSEVHGISITGVGIGATVNTSADVLFDRVHVHDTTDRGIATASLMDLPTSLVLRDSLVEHTVSVGVLGLDADVVVERSVIARSDSFGGGGLGVRVRSSCTGVCSESRASATLDGSLIDGASVVGLSVVAADAVVQGSVIRGTLPHSGDQSFGRGINVVAQCDQDQAVCDPLGRSSLLVSGSMIANNRDFGVFIGASDAIIESSTVRDTLPRAADEQSGLGVTARATRWPIAQAA